MLMRVVPVVLALAGGPGCAGCAVPIPFSLTEMGTIALPLGPVDPGCPDVSSNVDGGPQLDAQLAFAHHAVGGTCVMSTTWQGTLIDMAEVHRQVEQQLKSAGSPDLEDIELQTLEIDVPRVALVDLGNRRPLDTTGLQSLDCAVDVLGEQDVIVIRFDAADPEADPEDPDVTVHTTPALLGAVDDAFVGQEPVTGEATCEIRQDLDEMAALSSAEAPAVIMDLRIHVKGTTHASIGG